MITGDRWNKIDELFRAMYELPPEDRQAALRGVEDSDLRLDVEALLRSHEDLTATEDGFLEDLDTGRASALLEESGPRRMATDQIGRYRIVRSLARGGMGVVYLAHDPQLDRRVAIKLLPPHLSADPAAVQRLAEEARTASALDHPRIGTVYEIGETDEGGVFVAMAYYEGETLRERIRRGPMAVPEAIELGIQLAEGLSAAHRAGIIHRDIKPENVLITTDGALKIVDFGIAARLREGLATGGLLPGTAAYMSPEQTRGEALDGRTDLWSAGVVLYEMLTGDRPFRGEGEALIHAIRHDPAPDPSTLRPAFPDRLSFAVGECLAKERSRRPESAHVLAAQLRAIADGGAALAPSAARARDRSGRRLMAPIAAAAVILALAIPLARGGRQSPAAAAGDLPPAIAVLPFEIRGEEMGIWREGMVDLLSIGLEGATDLRVIDARTVLARWRETAGDAAVPDLEQSLQIASRTGARYAVIGSVVSRAQGLRFGARIYSLPDGRSLASLQVEGAADSLFALVDRLAVDILAATWQGRERPRQPVDLTRITTSSPAALKAYLEGEGLLRRGDFSGAAAAYERAVAADSTFAFALFHLGLAYGWLGDAARQDEAYSRAKRHAARLPEREVLLLRANGATSITDPVTTIALLSEVVRKYPDDPDAWYFLGDRYFHDGEQVLASLGESERAFQRVVELDPGFAPAYIHLVHNAFIHRPDSARATRLIEAYHRLAPTSDADQLNGIAFGLGFADSTHRLEAYGALDTLSLDDLYELAEQYLDHPRHWGTLETVLEVLRRRRTPVNELGNQLTTLRLFDHALSRGRLRIALAYLEDPLMPAGLRAAGSYRMYSAALPLSRPAPDPAALVPEPDSFPVRVQAVLVWFYSGAYAADQGRWEDHSRALDHLSAEREHFLVEGDSANARFVRGAATALLGKGLWARGDADRALPLLLEGQRQATWAVSPSRKALNESIRWWIGDLLLQEDRPGDAAPYFEASRNDPLAAERLGPIYERIGDSVRARAAYRLVDSAWRDADPELRPRAQAAYAALRRVGTAEGG